MSTWAEQMELAKTTTAELVCEGCGKKETMTLHEAYEAGWDCPPWFFTHITCPECPISTTLWWSMLQASKGENK